MFCFRSDKNFSCYGNIFFCINRDIWIFLQRYILGSPLRSIRLSSKLLNLVGCRAAKRVNFRKNVKKNFSETVRWIKLILCIHVYDISLYMINCVFYSSQ